MEEERYYLLVHENPEIDADIESRMRDLLSQYERPEVKNELITSRIISGYEKRLRVAHISIKDNDLGKLIDEITNLGVQKLEISKMPFSDKYLHSLLEERGCCCRE